MMQHNEPDYKNIFVAMFLALLLYGAWYVLIQAPRKEAARDYYKQRAVVEQSIKKEQAKKAVQGEIPAEVNPDLTREQRIALTSRLPIKSDYVHGSIALTGLHFDDLTLAKYHVDLSDDSDEVVLFSPNGGEDAYFAQVGWVAGDGTKVPDAHSVWKADKPALLGQDTVALRWNNGQGVEFVVHVALDDNYMFSLTQEVINHSAKEISVAPYGYINRTITHLGHQIYISHEGPLGVLSGALDELSYDDLKTEARKYKDAQGWFGLTDKYWLAAMIPDGQSIDVNFSHYNAHNKDRYQADYVGDVAVVAPKQSVSSGLRLFAGAKEINLLDAYTEGRKDGAPIALFDRAVDFGALYFMTKPMFLTLNYFYSHIGNFGIAILLLTIVVKIFLFPLAYKGYVAMARMKELQPEMKKINDKYVDDPMAKQKAMLELYKREKVNPAAGCFPLLVQMPIFFALYKVLYVTIEMRHAPFFGWLKDLSAPDPSNLFTAFGLIPWDHPSWVHLGVLPIAYCVSMVIQMSLQPKPTDPVQQKVMAFMPYGLMLLFAGFSAGLVLYWVWSNILTTLQQLVISQRIKHKHPHLKKR